MQRNTPRNTKRNIISFEPSGPVASMMAIALRGKLRGSKTELLEDAIVNLLRAKFPKLADRHDVLRAEK